MITRDTCRADSFLEKGWCRFPHDPALAQWIRHVLPAARRAATSPEHARWLRCGDTWFVGVNALPNDDQGAVDDGPALTGKVVDFIHHSLEMAKPAWDRAQISICYPGYPRRTDGESGAAHRYRVERDAAHVDGLLAEGVERRRYVREHHAFILGIPMVRTDPDASPFVVWEGSHEIVRAAFRNALRDVRPDAWCHVDITDIYHATRRRIFECCRRIEIAAVPGEAYLVHRLALHGMAPWRLSDSQPPEGRMICYFRPDIGDPSRWLTAP